jgi:hypothetical protein
MLGISISGSIIGSVDFSWYRQVTLEKTRPSTNVNGDSADVFVTLDSDTTLTRLKGVNALIYG